VIPYTTERRPDTGVTNVTLGIWLFLASEVMLFGALFSAYALLRTSAASWPSGRDVLNLPIGWANTLVLILMTTSIWRARGASLAGVRRWLAIGSLLALVFLVLKSIDYSTEIRHGIVPSLNTFVAMYFTLTGLHALHVIGGLIANLWAAIGARAAGDALTAGRVHALSLYWMFVDAVWLVIFVLLYLS